MSTKETSMETEIKAATVESKEDIRTFEEALYHIATTMTGSSYQKSAQKSLDSVQLHETEKTLCRRHVYGRILEDMPYLSDDKKEAAHTWLYANAEHANCSSNAIPAHKAWVKKELANLRHKQPTLLPIQFNFSADFSADLKEAFVTQLNTQLNPPAPVTVISEEKKTLGVTELSREQKKRKREPKQVRVPPAPPLLTPLAQFNNADLEGDPVEMAQLIFDSFMMNRYESSCDTAKQRISQCIDVLKLMLPI